ncbi:MAG TPA: stalk domain-containing protein [Abditibacteriaceae bacterium]
MRSSHRRSPQNRSVKASRPIEGSAPETCGESLSRLSLFSSTRALPGLYGAFVIGSLLSPLGAGAAPTGEATSGDVVQQAARVLLAQSAVENGPRVTIVQPGYNDVLKSKSSILINIEARRYPAASVEMFVDGKSATGGPIKVDEATSVPFNWDTALFADGPHRLTVRVTDTQGFRSDAEVQIYINNGRQADTSAPTLRWLNVRPGDLLRGDKVFQLEAADNFGIKYVWMSVKSAVTPGKPLRMSMGNQPPYTFPFDTRSVPDGLYILDALAWDAFENEGKAPPVLFGVANNTMQPTFIGDLDQARSTAHSSRTPSVLDSGIAAPTSKTFNRGNTVSNQVKPGVPNSLRAALPPGGAEETVRTPRRTVEAPGAEAMTSIPARQLATPPSTSRAASTRQAQIRAPRISALPLPRARSGAASTESATSREVQSYEPEATMSQARVVDTVSRGSSSTAPAKALREGGRVTAPSLAARGAGLETQPVVPPTAKSTASPVNEATALAALARPEKEPAKHVNSESGAPAASVMAANTLPSSISGVRGGSMQRSNPARVGRLNVQPRGQQPGGQQPRAATTATTVSGSRVALTPVAPSHNMTPAASRRSTTPVPPARIAPPVSLRNTLPTLAALPPSLSTPRRKYAAITVSLADDKASAMPVSHVASTGDTLLTVAARYGVPVDVLTSVNGLHSQLPAAPLKAGTKLNLPRTLTLQYAGKPVTGDVAAMMVGSTGVAPFRFLFEQQGGSLTWDASGQRVIARNDTQEITLTIGSRAAVVNRQQVMMDLAAFLLSGRTMVPLRFFEKALHAQVDWEPSTGRIFMTMATPQ